MKERLISLFNAGDYSALCADAEQLSAEQLAQVLSELDEETLVGFCRVLDSEAVADALVLLSPERQSLIFQNLYDDRLKEVMDEVSVDDTVEIIEDLPAAVGVRIAEHEEIMQLLELRNFKVLKPLLSELPPQDVAQILADTDKHDVALVFRILPKTLAADAFIELDPDLQQYILHGLTDKELKAMLDEIFVDDAVDIIEEMPASVVKRILAQSDEQTRDSINQILNYPKDSAGSIMTVEFIRLSVSDTVEGAFEKIRKTGSDKETIYTCYVTDEKRKLLGIVSVKTLLLSSPKQRISEVMTENAIYSYTTDSKDEVVLTINKYGFLALPIVDNEQRLVGIVTVDDAMDVLQETATEDIEALHAILPSDKPYLKTNPVKIFLQRLPWLLILMISATFTGIIINSYESTLGELADGLIGGLLIACIPMLMGTGGNAGSQASVTVIRGLAIGELRGRDVFRILIKELAVSVMLALVLGLACFGKLMLIDNLLLHYNYTANLSAVIALSLALTVIAAKLVGCTLPLVANACRLDPAIVANPFITTVVDALSLILYCNIAIAFLG